MNMFDLLYNFENGNTIRLSYKDGREYVVNNKQYKKPAFLRMVAKTKYFKVIHAHETA